MLSYDRLGSNGRLGNQMFQYAALRGIASNRGFDWMIPHKDVPSITDYCIQLPFKMKNLKESNIGTLNKNISNQERHSFYQLASSNPGVKNKMEKSFEFDENLFDTVEDNTNIDGFFQSEKYFKHIEQEIREDFEFIDRNNVIAINGGDDYLSNWEALCESLEAITGDKYEGGWEIL